MPNDLALVEPYIQKSLNKFSIMHCGSRQMVHDGSCRISVSYPNSVSMGTFD